jgi:undecaprenyl-phosphate glucose phosphotransferase
MRRAGDLIIASVLLAFAIPLMAFVALAIRYESQGPVFARSERVGIGGRRFNLLKFRTSRHDPKQPPWAEDVTRVGEFLQYTRIEYLPQLLNVLRGEMSLLDDRQERPHLFG